MRTNEQAETEVTSNANPLGEPIDVLLGSASAGGVVVYSRNWLAFESLSERFLELGLFAELTTLGDLVGDSESAGPWGPSASGAWALVIDHRAEGLLGDLLDWPAGPGLVELAEYVVGVREAVDTGALALVLDDERAVLVAASRQLSTQVWDTAWRGVERAGGGVDGRMLHQAVIQLDALGAELVAQRCRGSKVLFGASVREAARWGELTQRMLGSGCRISLRLEPPVVGEQWTVAPLVVALDDPSTALVAEDYLSTPGMLEARALLGSSPLELGRLLALGSKSLEECVGETLGAGGNFLASQALEDDQVVDLLSKSKELAGRGIELLGPAHVLKPVPSRSLLRVSGQSPGLVAQGLELEPVVEVLDEAGQVTVLSGDELAALATSKTGLVVAGGRWVRLDPAGRAAAARVVESVKNRRQSAAELLYEEVDIDASGVPGWVGKVLRGEPLGIAVAVDPDEDFLADLHDYQREGLGWLTWLEEQHIGGVLADDMGLGKTCQVLARISAAHEGATLVVCPTTLMDNWTKEAARFAPQLVVGRFHGPVRGSISALQARCDIVLTSYGVLARDPSLSEVEWFRIVLDEAQAIKNPETATARAAFGLKGERRLAVTGTPTENHYGDLWSIMRFAEPGLLGPRGRFEDRFVNSLPSPEAMESLRRLLAPLMLQRSKRDPKIAPELVARREQVVKCALTREQVGLYEATVRSLLDSVKDEQGASRRGQVLAGLLRLRQICVHPGLVVNRQRIDKRSGKIVMLTKMLRDLVDEGEAVVVFSQFASILPDLAVYLEEALGVEVLYMTGAHSLGRRRETIAAFSVPGGPPVFLVSLKVGGVGLNLVRARHAIHLDQWWNPAVEDQASDRLHRLGQQRDVLISRLIVPGTLEERIDLIVQSKRELGEALRGDGGLAGLDDDALAELVALVGSDGLLDEGDDVGEQVVLEMGGSGHGPMLALPAGAAV